MTDVNDVPLAEPVAMRIEPEPTTADVRAELMIFVRENKEAQELHAEYLKAKAKADESAKRAFDMHMKLLCGDKLASTGQETSAYRVSGRYGETVAVTINNDFEGYDKSKAITILEFEP